MKGFADYFEHNARHLNDLPCQTRFPPEELRKASILIVDDVEFNLMMMGEIFRSFGFYNLHFACDGEDALEKTESLKPDLVIMDILMPRLDGYGYISRLRTDGRFHDMRDLPVLMLTSASGEYEKRCAFKNGATDFVGKPAEKYELIARSATHIDRRLMMKKLTSEGKRMEAELDQARAMQNVILPTPEGIAYIERHYNVSISSFFRSSSELGGDFWGAEPLDEHRFSFYLSDFSGHGVASALNTFRLHTLMSRKDSRRGDPAAYLKNINGQLCHLLPCGQFATMFYAVYDKRDRSVAYASAASTFPIIAGKDGDAEILALDGFPLGANPKAEYDVYKRKLAQGDLFFIYSDSLIETPVSKAGGAREAISEAEIAKRLQLLRACASCDADFIEKLRREIKTIFYSEFNASPADDLTIVGMAAL